MPVFKKKAQKRERNVKIVGAQLPYTLHEYLSIYTIAHETTKSSIIVEILREWTEKMASAESIDYLVSLIQNLVHKGYKECKTLPLKRKYLHNVRVELQAKNISDNIISKILKQYD